MSMNSFHARKPKGKPVEQVRTPGPAHTPPHAHHGLLRADALLVQHGLAPSRTAAQRMIEAGRVRWCGPLGDEAIRKPAHLLEPDAKLLVAEDDADRFVSRGGLKLAGALTHSGIAVAGLTCLDVGQSTGGFTDCLLQAGAARVVGVDVGHDQLHQRLHGDPRLVCLEGINARELDASHLGTHLPAEGFDLIVADLSFISLGKVLPQLPPLLKRDGQMLLLVKPQFEVGPEGLAKGGVVRDERLYAAVEADLRRVCELLGLTVREWFDSPIIGGGVGNIAGNREFFLWITP